MARNRQKEFEQLINYDKVTREKILYEQRKRSLQHFEVDFLLLINAQTKNLLLEFMQFLAYTDLALRTCQGMKSNLVMFLTWNYNYNDNKNFRLITKKQGEDFFLYVKNMGSGYNRAKVIKSDIVSFADFIQFVVGKDEYHHNGKKNHWYNYNHEWREVDIQQQPEESEFKKCNVHTFSTERLDALKFYLMMTHDYMGAVILDFAYLGEALLTLQEDDELFNQQMASVKSYQKWKKREGAEHLPDVLIVRRQNGTYVPMSLSELRDYTRMFSVFLGKEFIIC